MLLYLHVPFNVEQYAQAVTRYPTLTQPLVVQLVISPCASDNDLKVRFFFESTIVRIYGSNNEYICSKTRYFYIDVNVNQSAMQAKFYHGSTNAINYDATQHTLQSNEKDYCFADTCP